MPESSVSPGREAALKMIRSSTKLIMLLFLGQGQYLSFEWHAGDLTPLLIEIQLHFKLNVYQGRQIWAAKSEMTTR